MQRFLPELSSADRKTKRQWNALLICVCILTMAGLLVIESLVSRLGDTESSHSASISRDSWSKQTEVSARVGSN